MLYNALCDALNWDRNWGMIPFRRIVAILSNTDSLFLASSAIPLMSARNSGIPGIHLLFLPEENMCIIGDRARIFLQLKSWAPGKNLLLQAPDLQSAAQVLNDGNYPQCFKKVPGVLCWRQVHLRRPSCRSTGPSRPPPCPFYKCLNL